jgi:hypothetical protein
MILFSVLMNDSNHLEVELYSCPTSSQSTTRPVESTTPTHTSEGEETETATEPYSHHSTDQQVNMLATYQPSAIGGHMFTGHTGQGKNPATIQMELQTLKASPILNPHFRMIQR